MVLGRDKDEFSVMEAVNHLSNMSEIDVKAPYEEREAIETDEIDWRDPRQALANEEIVKETFRVLHRYLQNMVRKDQNSLKDTKTQRGVQAIMLLASEAVAKMDKLSALQSNGSKVSKCKEYTDLVKYYRQHILKQMPLPREESEEWEEGALEPFEGVEEEKKGLQNLDGVRKDLNYELFFIKGENGKPLFSKSLLRHIRLVGNFDELVSKVEGEDPLLAVRELFDREILEGAKEALQYAAPYIDLFYKQGMKHKDLPFVGNLNKAVMALRMSANTVNLIENQSFKSCLEYYADFHRFLRDAMKAPGYRKRITGEMEEDEFSHILLNLTHALCCCFYMRTEPLKEALSLVHTIINRGDEMRGKRPQEKAKPKELQIWVDMQDWDESIRYLLNHYPNGPILRTLDAFREEEEFEGWDPLTHYNFPAQQFTMQAGPLHLTALRLPCPIKQQMIQRAAVSTDFIGFLRFYRSELKPDKHLMVNLQNRTSWEEYARCKAVEDTAARAEHHDTFHVLGLAKDSAFYHQDEEYVHASGAPVFLEMFEQHILGGEEFGFYFPEQIKKKELHSFIKQAFKTVHTHFFEKKTTLSRIERLQFIDIFYMLLVSKLVDFLKVDSISFTCKDALDTGAADAALYYGLVHMLSSEKAWGKQEVDHLLWLAYGPALLVRDRPIQQARWKRTLLSLETIHKACLANRSGLIKEINALYEQIEFPAKLG